MYAQSMDEESRELKVSNLHASNQESANFKEDLKSEIKKLKKELEHETRSNQTKDQFQMSNYEYMKNYNRHMF